MRCQVLACENPAALPGGPARGPRSRSRRARTQRPAAPDWPRPAEKSPGVHATKGTGTHTLCEQSSRNLQWAAAMRHADRQEGGGHLWCSWHHAVAARGPVSKRFALGLVSARVVANVPAAAGPHLVPEVGGRAAPLNEPFEKGEDHVWPRQAPRRRGFLAAGAHQDARAQPVPRLSCMDGKGGERV